MNSVPSSGWPLVPIGAVCQVFDGPHATPKKTAEGPLFLGISALRRGRLDLSETEHLSEQDYRTWTRRVEPRAGDIVFSYETRLGEAALIPDELRCCLGRRMGLLRADRAKVDPRFLLMAFLAPEFQTTIQQRTIQGSTVERIALEELPSFPIRMPPLSEQREIAALLGSLDDEIELNRRMNQTLEAMARALFKSWFIDFDPVEAKVAGRIPPALSPQIASLFADSFTDSEIGSIPKRWRVSRIGDEVTVVGGSTPSTAEPRYWEGGTINWITPRDLARSSDPVVLETERCITQEGLGQISSGLLPAGTVILSSRAPIGYVAIAEIPLAVNQGYIAMLCRRDLRHHYVVRWVEQNMEEILSRAGGTTFAEISKSSFRPIPVVVPDPDVLAAFDATVGPLHQRLVANVRESRVLISLRDILLPKLLAGEIRLKEADEAVDRALA
jgi:type I restriction enzyme S subunit